MSPSVPAFVSKLSPTELQAALSRRRRRQAISVAQALFAGPGGPPPRERLERFADDLEDHLSRSGPWTRLVIGVALWVLTWLAPLWRFRPLPFTRLALKTRIRVLCRIEQSFLQAAFFAVKAVFCLIYFEQAEGAVDSGVDPVELGSAAMSGAILHGRKQVGDLAIDTDVVVVGSGAGGAVVAAELAEAGFDTIVVEEGPHHTPREMGAMKPSESLRHVWREASMTAAVGVGNTPVVNVMMGRGVGGSSVVTGGVCFRIPEHILARWSGEMGLTDLTAKGLDPYFESVERAIHVETVPEEMRSRSTTLYADGAKAMGYALSPVRRNTQKCQGRSKCNFVCPHGAKRSVDLTYLPRAVNAGARILADAIVDQVLTLGDRAVGVAGAFLDADGRRRGQLTIAAKRVVLAAGAWHTPLILRESGIGRASHQVGRNMTLHPSVRVVGEFDQPVNGWEGAMQSAFSDAFLKDQLTLMSIFVPQSILAATMPGAGPEFMEKAQRIRHLAIFGGMVHDEGGGRVWRALGREPVVTYRMTPQNRASLSRLIRVLADTYLAAGARKVYLPIFGLPGVDAAGLKSLDFDKIPGRKIECTSQHPLGTCRMGIDPKSSVVNPDGETWDVREFYVADGSILPTSLGVNPQVGIMAMAARIAWKLREKQLPSRR